MWDVSLVSGEVWVLLRPEPMVIVMAVEVEVAVTRGGVCKRGAGSWATMILSGGSHE